MRVEVIDSGRLFDICDGDAGEVRTLLKMVTDSSADLVDRLGAAFDVSDLSEAKRVAHELRGAASTAGALELAALAERLDNELRAGQDMASAGARVPELRAALDRLLAAAAEL